MRPLANTVILDLTHMLSGPFATMILTDLGAETIKVEPPGRGEGTRALLADDPRHSIAGMGAYFLALNRGKKSVAIDLKTPEGHALFLELVKTADVVVDNFSAGVTERLGIDFPSLSKVNERIITCSVTGFGLTGPGANRSSFDLVAQAMGGGMTLTGEADGRALRAGIPVGDLGGGLFATIGILAALKERETSGCGQSVDVSMLDCQVSLLSYMATMFMMSGEQPARCGNGHFAHVPYDTFPTKSRDMIICVLTDIQWSALVEVVGEERLADTRFATRFGRLTHQAELVPILRSALQQQTCETWLERLASRGIPSAPVNDFEHALSDVQVVTRNMIQSVELGDGVSVRVPGNPIKLSRDTTDEFGPPPALGQDTIAVLTKRCGLNKDNVASLLARNIVG